MAWQAVEICPMETGEGFQTIERTGILERLGIQLDRGMRRIDARATACGLLGANRMRCGIGAEKEFRVARDGRRNQCLAMLFALQYRQAIHVWADAAAEHGVAVIL